MSVDARIPSCSNHPLPIDLGDVHSLIVFKELGQSEIDQVDFVHFFEPANHEIFRLYVSVHEVLSMQVLDSSDQLLHHQQRSND